MVLPLLIQQEQPCFPLNPLCYFQALLKHTSAKPTKLPVFQHEFPSEIHGIMLLFPPCVANATLNLIEKDLSIPVQSSHCERVKLKASQGYSLWIFLNHQRSDVSATYISTQITTELKKKIRLYIIIQKTQNVYLNLVLSQPF